MKQIFITLHTKTANNKGHLHLVGHSKNENKCGNIQSLVRFLVTGSIVFCLKCVLSEKQFQISPNPFNVIAT